jgi:hypothetical protein
MSVVDEIKSQLRTRGHIQSSVATDKEADEWRKAARAAARQLGRPVETVQHRYIVVASLRDWPANDLEQQIQDAEMSNVVSRIALGAKTPTR